MNYCRLRALRNTKGAAHLLAIEHQQDEQAADDEGAGGSEDERRRLEDGRVQLGEDLALLEGHHAVAGRAGGHAVREARGRRVGQVAQHAQLLHARQLLEVEGHVDLVRPDQLERQDDRLGADLHLHAVLQPRAEPLQEVRRLLGEQRLVLHGQEAPREVEGDLDRLDGRRHYVARSRCVNIGRLGQP